MTYARIYMYVHLPVVHTAVPSGVLAPPLALGVELLEQRRVVDTSVVCDIYVSV